MKSDLGRTDRRSTDSTRVSRKLPRYRDSIAGRLLAAREAVMSPIRPILREANVTEAQWRVLRVLVDEGTLDPSTLSINALLRPPSVSRVLQELLARNLILRETDPSDGRRSIVSVSETGRRLIDSTTDATLTMLDRYAAAFGVERLGELRAELLIFTEVIGPISFASDR